MKKFTRLAKIYTAAGSDGIDKFHLCSASQVFSAVTNKVPFKSFRLCEIFWICFESCDAAVVAGIYIYAPQLCQYEYKFGGKFPEKLHVSYQTFRQFG